jgi:predicted amidohydrolase YtcJ
MLIRNATLMNGQPADIRIGGNEIAALARTLAPRPNETIIDAAGGAALPGLHDHHIHLLALAAAFTSLDCATSTNARHLAERLKAASRGKPSLRAINYHERIAGNIDRHWLDQAVPNVPARLQHRCGRLWILNSAGLAEIAQNHPHARLSDATQSTGHLYDNDAMLRRPQTPAPNLAPLGHALASRGVTAVTDATPANDLAFIALIHRAQANGDLPQRVGIMGKAEILSAQPTENTIPLAHKLHLHEGDYPPPEAFIAMARHARAAGATLAVHCVTAADLIYTLALLQESGCSAGARIEHASLVPENMLPVLAASGVTIVTQPNFIAERGDDYRLDILPEQHTTLYRCATLQQAGIKLGGGTDAPFGHWDPWAAMQAATQRRTPSGAVLGPREILSPEAALAMFTTPLTDPGGTPRQLAAGEPADVCILHRPWKEARQNLGAVTVQATLREGRVIYRTEKLTGEKAA